MSMTRAGVTLLLMQIAMVCPMLLTPVTDMGSTAGDKSQEHSQMRLRAQFQVNKERVFKILEDREWNRIFLELLKAEMASAKHRKHSMHLVKTSRIRRASGDEDEATTAAAHSRSARSVPTSENSKVEVSAALKVDGKVCLRVTKQAEAARMGDSNEIIKADIGNTEILLSMKVTKKGADMNSSTEEAPSGAHSGAGTAQKSNPTNPPPPTPPPTPPLRTEINSASTYYPLPLTTPGSPAEAQKGEYSQNCEDRNYCLFGGTCTYYSIIDLQLCTCRKGYKGNRCELYDIKEVLSTLENADKRRVIGNGPIKGEEHMDVLSVVESTALYLLEVPNSYPSEQALQLMESLLRQS